MKQSFLKILILSFLVASCAGSPFVDKRREAGTIETVGESTLDMVAICYHPKKATTKQIYQLAKKECAKTKRTPKLHHKTSFTCRLTIPNHVYYKCIKNK